MTSLCGCRPHSKLDWTTKRHAVTCPRCEALLRESDDVFERQEPRAAVEQ